MKIRLVYAAVLQAALACGQVYAAAPGLMSYQATLRKNGALFSGTAAMEFSIVNADASQTYWTSGSTSVAVTSGLFRYPLGSPNEAQFSAIDWGSVTPYVRMKVDGGWMQPEPLYSSAYSLHAVSAESSSGSFTVRDGNIVISTTSGSRGITFQDGTVQYTASGWSRSGQNMYSSFTGNAGIGVAAPQARLDLQAPAGGYPQIWRDASGVVKASMTADGILYADASRMRNLPAGGGSADNLGDHTLTRNLVTGANWISFDGSPSGLNFDAAGNAGIGQAAGSARLDVRGSANNYIQLWRNNSGVLQASMTAAGLLYADGSALRNIPAGGTATRDLDMASFGVSNVSTMTAEYLYSGGTGVVFTTHALVMGGNLGVNTMLPQERLHVNGNILSTSLAGSGSRCVYADNYGVLRLSSDACGLAGVGGDQMGDHTMSQNLNTNGNWISGDGSSSGLTVSAGGNVGAGMAAAETRLDVKSGPDGYAQFWRDSSGVVVASMTSSGVLYADAAGIRNLPSGAADNLGDHTATQDLDLADHQLLRVSSVTAGYMLDTSLAGAANRCVYVDAGGVLRAKTSDCGTASGGDDLGSHTATQDLDMAGHSLVSADSVSASSLNASTIDSPGAGLSVSTNLFVASGSLGVNTSSPQERLHVVGNILSSGLSGASNRCVYADANGVLHAKTSDCGTASGGDDLGTHTMTQNLDTAGFWLSGDGTNKGALVDGYGNLLVTDVSSSGGAKLDVRGAYGGYAQVWRSEAGVEQASMSATGVLYADASGLRNLPRGADGLGDHVATTTLEMSGFPIVDAGAVTASGLTALSSVTISGVSGLSAVKLRLGPAEISTATPAQYGGIYVSTHVQLAAGGRFYGDGSGLSSLDASALSAGSLADARLSSNAALMNRVNTFSSSFTVTAPAGASLARAAFAPGVELSSAPSSRYGGVEFSTHVYLPSGAKYYGDGSPLTGVTDAGALSRSGGVMTGQLTLSGTTLTVDDGDSNTATSGLKFSNFACSGTNKLTTDVSGNVVCSVDQTGSGTGNTVDTLYETLSAGANAQGLGAVNLGALAVGRPAADADAILDVQSSGNYAQVWRDISGNIVSSMTVSGVLYADGSALRGLAGGNIADTLSATLTAGGDAGGLYIYNAGYVGTDDLTSFGQITAYSSATVLGADGMLAARVRFAPGVEMSSATAADHGGIYISTNVYLPPGAKFYGDGSGLSNISGAVGMANPATADFDLAAYNIVNGGVMHASGLVVGEISTAGEGVVISTNVGIGGSIGVQDSVIIGDSEGGVAPLEVAGSPASNILMHFNSNGGGYCDLYLSDAATCSSGTLLGTNNGKALCLICGS